MARIAVVYGSSEGQTATIAERIGDGLDERGHDVTLIHARHPPEGFSFSGYDAAVVGASIHVGKHQRYVTRFVRTHVDDLNRTPSAFFSVSLTAAESDPEARETVREMLERFLDETGWNPDRTFAVAGALKYSQYGRIKRFVMKRIASAAGGDTDTSRDYEYTNWDDVEAFTEDVAGLV